MGATPAAFSVSDGGSASYTIPIQVPPGTNGMAPELALAYTSQGANGMMGMGWAIRGLSAIARCPKTLATDGTFGGVGLTANDQLCLDGERLVLKSGTHLAVNAEYRAEREIFSKILVKQVAGQPIYFEVRTKAGRILEYGGTADSRLQPGTAPGVEAWHLSRISDRFDNYLTFTYELDNSDGWIRPSRVDYTGNGGAAPNFTPFASVRFVYALGSRPDSATRWGMGYAHDMDKRLDRIETYLGSTEVREYRLAYDQSAVTGASRLVSVTECSGGGQCLPPTTFGWPTSQLPQWTGPPSASTSITWDGGNIYLSADARGQGVADMIIVEKTTSSSNLKVVQPNSSGSYATLAGTTPTGIAWDGDDRWLAGDINADGFADVIALHQISGNYRELWTFRSNGNGTFTKLPASGSAPLVVYRDNPTAFLGDLDGDATADLLTIRRVRGASQFDEFHTYLSNGDGSWDPIANVVGGVDNEDEDECSNHHALDANGDGLLDVAAIRVAGNGNFEAKSLISDGAGRLAVQIWSPTSLSDNPNRRFLTNDANGDGLTDLIIIRKSNDDQNALRVLFNQGNGMFAEHPGVSTVGGWNLYEQWIPADLDGNGAGDFIRVRKEGLNPKVHAVLADGQGGYDRKDPDQNLVTDWSDYDRWLAGDATGKGITDLVRIYKSSNQINTQVVSPLTSSGTGPKVDQITTITDGVGKRITIVYDSIARISQGIYTKGSGAVYPKQDLQAASYVVKQTTESDVNGNLPRTFSHTYGQARMDLWGRGFVGYGTHSVTDQATGIVTTTTYGQSFPLEGFIASVESKLGAATLSRTTNQWVSEVLTTPNRQWVKLASSTLETHDANGALVGVTITSQAFDAYANPTSVTVKRKASAVAPDSTAFIETKTITYAPANETSWLIGIVSGVSVSHSAPSTPTLARSTSYATSPTTGALQTEISDPNTTFALTRSYQYDAVGNRNLATASGGDIATRSDASDFGAAGVIGGAADAFLRLPRKHTSPAGIVGASDYDYKFGVLTKQEGPYFDPAPPSPIRTTYTFDALGRITSSTAPDGIVTTVTRSTVVTACPAFSRYTETTSTTGQPPVTVCFDALGREKSRQTPGFAGVVVRVDTDYDSAGRVQRTSQPYQVGDPVYWTTPTYDALNRVVATALPDGSLETTAYNGLVATITNALLQTRVETRDLRGTLVGVTEGTSSSMDYTYDAAGRVLTARDASSNTITNLYNVRGLKTQMIDPDMGTWTYAYNSLGELVTQTDAKLQATTFGYDLIGRMRTRTDPTGSTTWDFDLAANGVGQPYRTTGSEQSYQKTFEYDVFGRPTKSTTRVGSTDYVVQATYDASGRREKTIYPGGFATRNVYNAQSYLSQVNEDGSSTVFWRADAVNAFGSVKAETLGNGLVTQRTFEPDTGRLLTITTGAGGSAGVQNLAYVWDDLGNLRRRSDIVVGRIEQLVYDNLNRLTSSSGVGLPSKAFDYDALGNITAKTGVGSYTYGSGITVNGAGPHAVKTAGGVTYAYDANGNMVSGTNGRSVTYTAYNKPRTIGSSSGNSTFYYGGERELVVQVESNGSTSATRTYIGDVYEKSVVGATTEERFYIRSPAGLVAIRSTRTGQPTSVRYVHRDHLGSTDVLSDATGAVVQRMSFDAWGKRRDPATWSDSALFAFAFEGGLGFSVTPQFTGHKGLGHLELVHMEGRVYDPVLGRFLSADPYVQDSSSTQAFNRYSYVWNNPLSYTDPSGYFSLKSVAKIMLGPFYRLWAKFSAWVQRLAKKQWLAPIVGAVLSFVPGVGPLLAAIVAAGLQAAINGGSIGEIFMAGAVAFATGAITQGALTGLGTALQKILPKPTPLLGAGAGTSMALSSEGLKTAATSAGSTAADSLMAASAAATPAAVGGASVDPLAEAEPRVSVGCRPVGGFEAFDHCSITIWQGSEPRTATILRQYSIGGGETEFSTSSETALHDKDQFLNPGGNDGRNFSIEIHPHPGMSQVDLANNISAQASAYRGGPYDGVLGPNSNTGVGWVLNRQGYRVPPGLVRAWQVRHAIRPTPGPVPACMRR